MINKLKNKKILIILGSVFLLLFVFFTWIVKKDGFTQFDFDTTVRIQNHIPKKYDMFLSFLSLVGSFEIMITVLIITVFFRRKILGLITFFLFFIAHVLEIIGKMFLTHPGPPFLFFRYNIPFLFPSSYVQPGSSYPSGHSLRIVYVSIILVYLSLISKRLNKPIKIILSVFFSGLLFLTLVSRVSLGEHWTTDVIGGSLLGASMAFFTLLFL